MFTNIKTFEQNLKFKIYNIFIFYEKNYVQGYNILTVKHEFF